MGAEYHEYRVRKIVNTHKHVDGPWFWGKYTAHPYVGCRSGCHFCYSRGGRYLGRNRDPDTFDRIIQVKVNTIDRLQKELPRLKHEIISVGDWQQAAESRYRLSRSMLEIVLDCGFPLFIVERSPLLTRDIDLLREINSKTYVGVLLSFSNVVPALKRIFEPRSPGIKRRLNMMAALADAGIYVGTAMMPVIPLAGDDETHLEEMVRATKDHGGKCLIGGGMTMDGVQAERTLAAMQRINPELEAPLRKMFRWPQGGNPSYGPPGAYNTWLGLKLKELTEKHGLLDRMPRYVTPGPLAVNKRIAEKLLLKTYYLELEQASSSRIWAYRKAGWTVDEWPENIADLFDAQGITGLRKLPGIGQSLAGLIAKWLRELSK